MEEFYNSDYFAYLVLPLLIFCARIFDQAIGIIRIIFATKGLKYQALLAGFFESLVWLMAVSQILQRLDNIFCYIAFSAGFAAGNFIGIYLEKKISIGFVIVRVVFMKDSAETIKLLKDADYKLTIVDAEGMAGPVKMLFSTVKRSKISNFIDILKENNPTAFYTVEEAKIVKDGYLPAERKYRNINFLRK
ncbi:MAG: DUF2179 domain-containing protein [Rhodothermaceae bacterium]